MWEDVMCSVQIYCVGMKTQLSYIKKKALQMDNILSIVGIRPTETLIFTVQIHTY